MIGGVDLLFQLNDLCCGLLFNVGGLFSSRLDLVLELQLSLSETFAC